MESANSSSTRLFQASPGDSHFAFVFPTQQSPSQASSSGPSVSPSSVGSSSGISPPGSSFSLQSTGLALPSLASLLGIPQSSRDPPATGPSSNMASLARQRAGVPPASAFASRAAALPARAASTTTTTTTTATMRRRTTRRNHEPADAPQLARLKDPPRRSSRSRKRPPSLVSIPASRDESRDPPAAKKPRRGNLKAPPPGSKPDPVEDEEEDSKPKAIESASCCICMEEPKPEDLASISGCDHLFCFECIEKWAERENTCPLCKERFSKIDRVNKSKKRGGSRPKNTKKVKRRDQRSDLNPGAALEGLLASFAMAPGVGPHRGLSSLFARLGGPGIYVGPPPPRGSDGSSSYAEGHRLVAARDVSRRTGSTAAASSAAAGSRTGSSAAARRSAAASLASFEDAFLSSDTDDDDDFVSFLPGPGNARSPTIDSFFDQLRAEMPGSRSRPPSYATVVGGTRFLGLHPLGMNPYNHNARASTAPPTAAAAVSTSRNYATNGNDRTAGTDSNPLEIDDSDDDDDVEVVQVTRPI